MKLISSEELEQNSNYQKRCSITVFVLNVRLYNVLITRLIVIDIVPLMNYFVISGCFVIARSLIVIDRC